MKQVRVAELKARLSEYLRYVRRGDTVTVFDRDRPVALVVPYERGEPLRIRARAGGTGAGAPRDVPLPPPLPLDLDIVDVLMQERQIGR